MKITCQSCQSKYNVADEKVQGKIVKIRCRKCGGTIVVNAAAGSSSSNGASGASLGANDGVNVSLGPAPASSTGEWHVNLGDTDPRTMSIQEVVAAYNAGQITQDTFIWTDGMDDWKPLAEVDAVVTALHASAAQDPATQAPSYEAPAPAAYQAPAAPAYEAPAPVAYSPPAAAAYAAPAASAPAVEAKRAAVTKREARGRDLFSTQVGEELQTSAPAASAVMGQPVDDGKLTGQRNENSVLFSLAVLTKSGEDRAPGSAPAAKDDSGMIDLKALVAKAESTRPAARPDADAFAPPLGFAAPPMTAPLGPLGVPGAEPQGKSKLPMLIGAGAGVALLLVLGIVIGAKLAGAGSAPAAAASAAASVAVPSATASAEPTASAPPPEASASAAPSASVASTASAKPKTGGGGGWHPPAGGGKAPSGGNASPATGAAGLPPSPAPKPKGGGGDCGCNGDLMCLMKCSTH
jgi:predicted Zn finger-like uncharacterized protein